MLKQQNITVQYYMVFKILLQWKWDIMNNYKFCTYAYANAVLQCILYFDRFRFTPKCYD